MRSATYWTWIASGSARNDECSDTPCVCWVCGGEAQRSIDKTKWLGASYTSQTRVKSWQSTRVCEPCVVIHSRTSEVPGRPPKEGKKFGGNWRNYSVLVEIIEGKPLLVTATKGEKGIIREWLQRAKRGPWFAAIAESGQKHVIPLAPMNEAGQRIVQFEEQALNLPESWELVQAIEDALTAGLSKEGIETGQYTVRQYQQFEGVIEHFESDWAQERGSPWFDLALFLAQKREDNATDTGSKKASNPVDNRSTAVPAKGNATKRNTPIRTLGTTTKQTGNRKPDGGKARPLVLHSTAGSDPPGGQLELL